tara:strand:+ start:145 stop:351 length:207 start_codon:yes stop_codon:yes gene_type:complete
MFNWFRKNKKVELASTEERETEDAIEESLWEIKEEYDLPTEEIYDVVYSKRKNIEHMRKMLLQDKNLK